ncbi:nuclear transport factor 2 family protein [Sphingopyxis sp.]|uniref:nuclear transport factor 2 family protein n=1 Tax=Sphingopyxis sp. TaxID=1908224 RepID=UPI003D6CF37A
MLKMVVFVLLMGLPTFVGAQNPVDGQRSESVVRALIDAGNRSDLEAWLSLFHPDAKHFVKSKSDDSLADRPSSRVVDSTSRRAFYQEIFARPQKTRGEIVELVSLGELVMSRGIFHRPEGRSHTLTVYRVRDGKIVDIWDVEQVAE